MRSVAAFLSALTLTGAVFAQPATAQPPHDGDRGPKVCFHRDRNFRGPAYCIRPGDRVKYVGGKYNDKFSSVRIPRGVKATMCHDANFKGVCMTFDNSVSNFSILLFNDVISSVSAQWKDSARPRRDDARSRDRDRRDRGRPRGSDRDRREDRRRAGGGDQVCLYEHARFRGRAFCTPVGASVNWVGGRANDIFSSLRVPRGARVVVCQDQDFRGRCRGFHRSVDAFGGRWNDVISSFRSRRR